jgi:hypothetical protein
MKTINQNLFGESFDREKMKPSTPQGEVFIHQFEIEGSCSRYLDILLDNKC